ncbi:MAG: preprotein translocase subunit YajC [Proteobacteria bacterium]|nr:preprotein translocase subunit YajC [Pseudomonadota bacterium]
MTASTTFLTLVFAQSDGGTNALAFLFPLVVMGGLFYVLLILPQRRRQKKSEAMRSNIGIGDEVRTIGGIIGHVVDEDDDTFTLDLGGTTMRIVKRAVAERVSGDDDES